MQKLTFPEFVQQEVLSAVYYMTGCLTGVSCFCDYDTNEPQVIRKQITPSQDLRPSSEQGKISSKRGFFATSFDKIPCDQVIKQCQFRTGRRYIQADNFPDDSSLDHYLGLMNKSSSIKEPLRTNESTLSIDFATEDHLDFCCLAQNIAEKLKDLDSNKIQAIRDYYPGLVDHISDDKIIEYFTSTSEKEDKESLQKLFFHIRKLGSTNDYINDSSFRCENSEFSLSL